MWGIYLGVGAWLLALSAYELRFGLLPNALTVPGIALSWGWAAWVEPWWLLGGIAWALLYLILGLGLGGIGGGDVKLAASLGVLASAGNGEVGWFVAVAGASIASLLVMVLLRRQRVPHGPSMILSTLCATVM